MAKEKGIKDLGDLPGIGMKKRIKVYEAKRGWKNVVANGIIPL